MIYCPQGLLFISIRMSRKPLFVANWKMGVVRRGGENLLALHMCRISDVWGKKAEIAVCPSFCSLEAVSMTLKGNHIALGAQDCFWESVGAFTGEISPLALKAIGVRYILLGHSERRLYLNESWEMINKKMKAVLSISSLIPILCVGETLLQRTQGHVEKELHAQLREAFKGIDPIQWKRVVVAYEPVWAVGSGKAVTAKECKEACTAIRSWFFQQDERAVLSRLIYGGSVDASNITSFIGPESADGVLVGGASLDAKKFSHILSTFFLRYAA